MLQQYAWSRSGIFPSAKAVSVIHRLFFDGFSIHEPLPEIDMENAAISLKGKTIRWIFSEGPLAGKTFEHVFNEDGSVDYSPVTNGKKGNSTRENRSAVVQIDEDIHVVSYLAASGNTFTAVLNTRTKKMTGFASNEEQWFQQDGEFEILDGWHPENLITPQPLV